MSLLFILQLAFAQVQGQDVPVRLGNGLANKNVKELAKLFDDRVDITLDDQKRDYSHQQAQVVLSEFLNDFKEISFELIHSGQTENLSKYYIGKMVTDIDIYRVYLYIKHLNSKDYIQSIKFEKQ